MPSTRTIAVDRLRARAAAFALLARLLGPETSVLTDGATLPALREALDPERDASVLARLECVNRELPRAEELAGSWVRWFDLGRLAPYEGSNVAPGAGGITSRLADIAGFYRAFGMAVAGDRPDHVVAEMEFMAVGLLAEAEAWRRGDSERAATTADVMRAFLRDHLGGWLDAWAARVGEIAELAPWFSIAAAAAEFVSAEAADRNVIPLRDSPVLPADAGLAQDDEADLACGGGPARQRHR